MKFLCDQCKAKYQIADEKVQGKTLRMKCRKCGHVIEIRAAVDAPSSGDTMQLPSLSEDAASQIAKPSAPAAKLAPKPGAAPAPRPAAGAAPRPGASTGPRPTAGKPVPGAAPRPSHAQGGALASAFSKQVSSGHEPPPSSRAPTPDLPAEEWYVAVDEVPVGPIRLTELRAKYAQGAVHDDSLVWREGYEEWRPLRTLADLYEVVREEVSGAAGAQRGSLLPNNNGRLSTGRQSATSSPARSTSPARPASPAPGPAQRNAGNVIPFAARGGAGGAAAARKVDEEFEDEATQIAASPFAVPPKPVEPMPVSGPKVVDDPFAPLAPTAPAATAPMPAPIAPTSVAAADDVGRATMLDRLQARGLSKGTVALIAAACLLFGVVIAVLAVKPKVVEKVVEKRVDVPVSVYVPVPGQPAPGTTETAAPSDPSSTAPKVAWKGGPAPGPATSAAPTTTVTNKKLGSLDGPEGPAVGGPSGPGTGGGQALDGKAVETVVASKRVGVRKQCYEPWADKGNASVKVTLRIGPDGKVSSSEIATSSGEPAIGQCVQRLAKSWTFPPSEAGGTFNVPFLFGS